MKGRAAGHVETLISGRALAAFKAVLVVVEEEGNLPLRFIPITPAIASPGVFKPRPK